MTSSQNTSPAPTASVFEALTTDAPFDYDAWYAAGGREAMERCAQLGRQS